MSEPVRLLLCSFDVLPAPTGASRRVTEYLRGLAGHFQVDVLTVGRADLPHVETLHGARLLRVPVGDPAPDAWADARAQAFERAVRRQVQGGDYALALFTDPVSGSALCEAQATHGYRLVYEAVTLPSGEASHGDARTRARLRRQELHCLTNADLVLTGAPTSAAWLRTLGVEPRRVAVLRAPADVAAHAAAPQPAGSELRAVSFVGAADTHDTEALLDAVALAGPRVHLTLLAPDTARADLAARAGLRGLGPRVRVLPRPPHPGLPAVLHDADVGVLPLRDGARNRDHGAPLPAASELLAAGLPVVAADLPVCRELLPATGAVFVPPSDAHALAGALARLADDRAARESMGRTARAYAVASLGTAVVAAQLRSHLATCLGGAAHPVAPTPLPAPAMPTQVDTADVIELGDEDFHLHEEPEPALARPTTPAPILEAVEEYAPPPPPEPAPWPSLLDGWYAQAAHGYCPPVVEESARPVVRPPALPLHLRPSVPRKA